MIHIVGYHAKYGCERRSNIRVCQDTIIDSNTGAERGYSLITLLPAHRGMFRHVVKIWGIAAKEREYLE